jgi:hypothetical protein
VLHLFAPGGLAWVVWATAWRQSDSRDNAVTAGMGWFYGKDDDGMHMGMPVLIVGGEAPRMTRRSKFITENYLFMAGAVVSAGSRNHEAQRVHGVSAGCSSLSTTPHFPGRWSTSCSTRRPVSATSVRRPRS